MALEAAFGDLTAQLLNLREVLHELHLTVVEDKPLKGQVALVEKFADTVQDVRGQTEEALAAAADGQQAVGRPLDMDRARRALALVQERFNELSQRFSADLVSYEQIGQLKTLGQRRGGEWLAWVSSAKEGLDRCQPSLYAVNQALFVCWQEIAERVGMNSVSVQTTNIGQHITTPEIKEAARAQQQPLASAH